MSTAMLVAMANKDEGIRGGITSSCAFGRKKARKSLNFFQNSISYPSEDPASLKKTVSFQNNAASLQEHFPQFPSGLINSLLETASNDIVKASHLIQQVSDTNPGNALNGLGSSSRSKRRTRHWSDDSMDATGVEYTDRIGGQSESSMMHDTQSSGSSDDDEEIRTPVDPEVHYSLVRNKNFQPLNLNKNLSESFSESSNSSTLNHTVTDDCNKSYRSIGLHSPHSNIEDILSLGNQHPDHPITPANECSVLSNNNTNSLLNNHCVPSGLLPSIHNNNVIPPTAAVTPVDSNSVNDSGNLSGLRKSLRILSRVVLTQYDKITQLQHNYVQMSEDNKQIKASLAKSSEELRQCREANQALQYYLSASNQVGFPDQSFFGGGDGFGFPFHRGPDVF